MSVSPDRLAELLSTAKQQNQLTDSPHLLPHRIINKQERLVAWALHDARKASAVAKMLSFNHYKSADERLLEEHQRHLGHVFAVVDRQMRKNAGAQFDDLRALCMLLGIIEPDERMFGPSDLRRDQTYLDRDRNVMAPKGVYSYGVTFKRVHVFGNNIHIARRLEKLKIAGTDDSLACLEMIEETYLDPHKIVKEAVRPIRGETLYRTQAPYRGWMLQIGTVTGKGAERYPTYQPTYPELSTLVQPAELALA